MTSHGQAAMVSYVRLAIFATMADGPYEVIQEQTSKGQSPWNGLAEGAANEVKAKIRTLQYEMEGGLSRTVPENHDTPTWLLQHAAATINWHRTGVDGRTPFQRRTGKSFRRVVAPFGQKVMWLATGRDASRIGAESRSCEGIFFGPFCFFLWRLQDNLDIPEFDRTFGSPRSFWCTPPPRVGSISSCSWLCWQSKSCRQGTKLDHCVLACGYCRLYAHSNMRNEA